MDTRVMIMAAGTGGHVFPGLATAAELQQRGHEVFWLGTRSGMENRLVPKSGIELEVIDMKGLRKNGIARLLAAPFQLLRAAWQVFTILRKRKPTVVVGMGGFVTGPGGVVARLMGIPLIIHEQNAVPGLANRLLSKIATRVLEAFPGSFEAEKAALAVGNPVRSDIADIAEPKTRLGNRSGNPRLLIIGGSLGAQALNEHVPAAVGKLDIEIDIRHQAGRGKAELAEKCYSEAGVNAEISEFIDDMAAAYTWADLVICRAGALTISELAAAGIPAILVPYPHAVDDHQTKNASYLSNRGGAMLMPQGEMDAKSLADQMRGILSDRKKLMEMAIKSRELGVVGADAAVADECEKVMPR